MNARAGSTGFEELGFGSVHHHFHHSSVGFGTGGPVRARGEDQLRASPNERRGPDRCVGSFPSGERGGQVPEGAVVLVGAVHPVRRFEKVVETAPEIGLRPRVLGCVAHDPEGTEACVARKWP